MLKQFGYLFAHFGGMFLIVPFIFAPGGSRWNFIDNGFAQGGSSDVIIGFCLVLLALYTMFYSLSITETLCEKPAAFIAICVVFAIAWFSFVLWAVDKGFWSIDEPSDWVWVGMIYSFIIAAYTFVKGGSKHSMVGLKFLGWFGAMYCVTAAVFWILSVNGNDGSSAASFIGIIAIVIFLAVFFFGQHITETLIGGGGALILQVIVLCAIYFGFQLLAVRGGFSTLDTAEDWAFMGTIMACMTGALAMAKADGAEE